jgi:hypothetical protein
MDNRCDDTTGIGRIHSVVLYERSQFMMGYLDLLQMLEFFFYFFLPIMGFVWGVKIAFNWIFMKV